MKHQSVMTDEVLDLIELENRDCVVDCTFGAGGHSLRILSNLDKNGRLIAIDVDSMALLQAPEDLKNDSRVTLVEGNFRSLSSILDRLRIDHVDAIIADLGWRSEQFNHGNKGFSFAISEPLLMTFGDSENYSFTAHDIVNDWEEESIADIIYGYGEEPKARQIAAAIIANRQIKPISTSLELAQIVMSVYGSRNQVRRIHPATKTFQALRIAINDELGALKELLLASINRLKPKGRLIVISFHSLEDRIVKQTFRSLAHDQIATLITKKPMKPHKEEIDNNPRSRSAKLRCIEKI